MNHHDELRELLPLAAAGELDAEDIARVRGHIAECAACGEEFTHWQTVIADLGRLPPQPAVPAWLAQRTIEGVKRSREAAEERRWNNRVLAMLAAFSWVVSLASWPVVHLATGAGLLTWFGWSLVLCWITAGSAAVVLGLHARGSHLNISLLKNISLLNSGRNI